jgi:hypothetical protein
VNATAQRRRRRRDVRRLNELGRHDTALAQYLERQATTGQPSTSQEPRR